MSQQVEYSNAKYWFRHVSLVGVLVTLFAGMAQNTLAGTLSGLSAVAPAAVNLTTDGTADWIHWGRVNATAVDRKAVVTPQITTWTPVGAVTPFANSSGHSKYSWTDGTPVAVIASNATGVRVLLVNGGFQFTVPADTNIKTLKVYLGLNNARGKLNATLSDGSAAPLNLLITQASGRKSHVATLTFQADAVGQTLTVTLTLDAVFGTTFKWLNLESAALKAAGTPPPPPVNAVPDPSFEDPVATTKWISSDGLSGLSTAQARTGAQSMRLESNGASVNHNVTQSDIALPGASTGQEYEYTIFVRAEDVTGTSPNGKPLTVLRWKNATNGNLTNELFGSAPQGTYEFQPLRLNFQAPAGAKKINVGLRSWAGVLTGTTYWDDVLLVRRVVPGRGALMSAYEAELANTQTGGVVGSTLPDFRGTGYFDVTTSGAILEWTGVVGGGSRVIAVRYSWQDAPHTLQLFVNGASKGPRTPVLTGRRGSYATANWALNLPNATNTVRVRILKSAGPEAVQPLIDRLEVYGSTP